MTPASEPATDQPRERGWLATRPRVRALAAGLLFGLFNAAAFYVPGLWWCAFLAPTPVMALGARPIVRPGVAGAYAVLGVVPWWGFSHAWTYAVSAAGVYPLVLALSLFTWLYVWVAGRAATRWGVRAGVALAPVLWIGVEFFRGSVAFRGYGFFLTGHPLIESPGAVFAQTAGWLGAYFVSFLVALVSAGVAAAVLLGRQGARASVGMVGAGAVGLIGGAIAGSGAGAPGPVVRVGVVQSNIPQDNRMSWTFRQRVYDYLQLRDLSVLAANEGAEVIVWPEGMFPGRALDPASLATERASPSAWPLDPVDPDDAPELTGVGGMIAASTLADELFAFERAIGVPMVVGATGYDGLRIEREGTRVRYRSDAMYNSAFLIEGGAIAGARYDKLHLAPFGEVMPYISAWPWLERQMLAIGAAGMSFDLEPGRDPVVLEAETAGGPVAMATPICFEATVPSVCRRLVFDHGRRRAGLLVNMTNDGWFGAWRSGREHHAQAARWRCVELGTPMVRAANTGISIAYDARGRVISREILAAGGERTDRDRVGGVLVAGVPMGTGRTLYAVVGDAFGWACLGATALGLSLTLMPRHGVGAADEPMEGAGSPRRATERRRR